MSTRRRGNYSPNMSMPGSGTPRSGRGVFAILLCLLLPPLGLLFLWRKGVFRARGRVLVSALATAEMLLIATLLIPASTLQSEDPLPVNAERYTPAPDSEALNALSNMDELLRAQQGPVAGSTVAPIDQEAERAAQQEVLATVVYAVYDSGARYYHSQTVCGNQSNLRSLTVQEALAEGLGPCPDCNPPAYSSTGVTATAEPAE